ncbi:hypothetical protein NQZ68_015978 [Dissostichus eleginoides]|nr:hypothetical protein NQZ68_015978 [Dissostichus eleginoides]
MEGLPGGTWHCNHSASTFSTSLGKDNVTADYLSRCFSERLEGGECVMATATHTGMSPPPSGPSLALDGESCRSSRGLLVSDLTSPLQSLSNREAERQSCRVLS